MSKEPEKAEKTPPPLSRPPIEVLERARQNLFGVPSTPIQLREPGWTCVWVNADLRPDRIWGKKAEGYLPVRKTELLDPDQVGEFVVENGEVVRGLHGRERLFRIPTDHYNELKKAQAEARTRMVRNPHATRDQVAQAASAHLGDRAADFLSQATIIGEVKTMKERIEVLDEE